MARRSTPRKLATERADPIVDHDRDQLVAGYVVDRAKAWLAEDVRRTRAGLARVAGLRDEQVQDLLDGMRRPTLRTMRALSRAVGARYEDLEGAAASWLDERARQPPPRRASPAAPRLAADRYPNRARALAAARLLDNDERDIETVLAVVLPPGAQDPSPKVWLSWVDRAREERLGGARAATPPRRPARRSSPRP